MSFNHLQIVKYGAVGVVVNVAGYALFLLLLWLGIEHKLAVTLLYPVGALVSFWLNRTLVFRSEVSLPSSLVRLILMLLSGYILNIGMLYFFVDRNGHDPRIIQIFSFIAVAVLFFLVNKLFVHGNRGQ